MAKKIKVKIEVEKYQSIAGIIFDTKHLCKTY